MQLFVISYCALDTTVHHHAHISPYQKIQVLQLHTHSRTTQAFQVLQLKILQIFSTTATLPTAQLTDAISSALVVEQGIMGQIYNWLVFKFLSLRMLLLDTMK